MVDKKEETKKKTKLEVKKILAEDVEDIHEYNNTFYSTNAHIDFDGSHISLDFLRQSSRANKSKYVKVTEHNSVMLNIFHAKDLAEKLSAIIKELEKQFGTVEIPEFMKKVQSETKSQAQKLMKGANTQVEGVTAKDSQYIG